MSMRLLPTLVLALARVAARCDAGVPCLSKHVGCNATFGTNNSGCCSLDDPHAVCCQTVLVGPTGPITPGNQGLKRSYCCPKGSKCTERGCTLPIPAPALCGPTQGGADGPAGNIRGMVSVEQHRGPEQTKAFLNRLPDKVVRDGRIIDVKAGLLDGGDDAPKKEGPPTPGVDLDKLREERLKRFG